MRFIYLNVKSQHGIISNHEREKLEIIRALTQIHLRVKKALRIHQNIKSQHVKFSDFQTAVLLAPTNKM